MKYQNRPFSVHRPDSYFVELTIDEWAESAHMAVNRQVASERASLRHTYDSSRDMFREITSMHAERAFSVFTGMVWHQIERDTKDEIVNVHGPDVGEYQVRQAPGGKNRSLIVRDGDRPDDVFVLVLGWHRLYEITGWMTGAEARQSRYRMAPDPSRPPCWMVPPEALHPISEKIANPRDRFCGSVAIVRGAWKEKYGNVSKAG